MELNAARGSSCCHLRFPNMLHEMQLLPDGDGGLSGAQFFRSHTPQATIVRILLALVLVCAKTSAQEPTRPQPSESSVEWVAADPPQPKASLFPLRQINWADVAPADDQAVAPGSDPAAQPPADKPPEQAHTGFKALVFETASDFKAFPRRRSTWVILAIGGAAAAAAHPADVKVTEHLSTSDAAGKFFVAGKWIGSDYVQAGAAIGLYVVGRYLLPHEDGAPKTNKVSHLGFDLLRALAVSQALTQGIKVAVQRDRPTGDCCAFPSGHASAAFAAASVIERHLGRRGAWPTFAIASYVAASRLADNRHYLSDVLFGSALGIASGWTVVGRHGRETYAFAPVPVPGGFMVSVSRVPKQPAP
jgi:membrane-associated phospholipid phosphatase